MLESPRYILKVKPVGFSSGLERAGERNGGVKNESKVGISDWRMGMPFH